MSNLDLPSHMKPEFSSLNDCKPDIRIPIPILRAIARMIEEGHAGIEEQFLTYHFSEGGNLTVARTVDGVDSIDFWINPGR